MEEVPATLIKFDIFSIVFHCTLFLHICNTVSLLSLELSFHTTFYKPGNGARVTGSSFAKTAENSRVCNSKCLQRVQKETCKGRDLVYFQLKVH